MAPKPAADPWVEVLDKASGQVYYWNQTTNETTHVGAPKPTGLTAVYQSQIVQHQGQQPSMLAGLGGMMAQGVALGVGSSIGHSMVNSMMGGSHHSSGGESSGGGGGGDAGDSFDM